MAKKETKAKKNDFNLESALNELEISSQLKAGFAYHINEKNISIKSENDLKRELTKFKEGA